jgi:hypothetical protein
MWEALGSRSRAKKKKNEMKYNKIKRLGTTCIFLSINQLYKV